MTAAEEAFKRWYTEYEKDNKDRASDEDDLREAFWAGLHYAQTVTE